MEIFLKNLNQIYKRLYLADHLLYKVFPLIKDKKILLKILYEIKMSIVECINLILHYEYLKKRIIIHKDFNLNFEIFLKKCSSKYGIFEKELEGIQELFKIMKQQKLSSIDLLKENKIIILSENMQKTTIEYEKVGKFLGLGKLLLERTKNKLLRKI